MTLYAICYITNCDASMCFFAFKLWFLTYDLVVCFFSEWEVISMLVLLQQVSFALFLRFFFASSPASSSISSC